VNEEWRAWSARYHPRRRSWRIGDRFCLNRVPEPLVFEISDISHKVITFWAPFFDHPEDRLGKRARHYRRADFMRDLRRRKIVRL
jgi:hypothetical protein